MAGHDPEIRAVLVDEITDADWLQAALPKPCAVCCTSGALAAPVNFAYYLLWYSNLQDGMLDSPPAEVTAQAMSKAIEIAWRNKLFTQDMAAEALGMSQSQISKIIRGQFKKPKGNAKALYEYSKRLAESRPKDLESAESTRASLTEKLFRAWDGTVEGGCALGDILDGAHKLRTRRA